MRIITDIAIFGLMLFGSMLDSKSPLPILACAVCLIWLLFAAMKMPRSAGTLPEQIGNDSKRSISHYVQMPKVR